MRHLLTAVALSALVAGCGEHNHGDHSGHHGDEPSGDEKSSDAKLVDNLPDKMAAAAGRVTGFTNDMMMIDHGAIQGTTMGAMNMGFSYMSDVDISQVKEGDEINFLMKIGRDESLRIVGFCKPAEEGNDCLQSRL